mgnify:CR=1 FL=1
MIRVIDIVIASFLLVLLGPLLISCALILRFTGEREVLYLQPRIGKFGKPFMIVKFATMLKNSPNIASGNLTLRNDPRILPFGKILRASKFNELPQLLNIVNGDMSLVGPRPVTPDHFNGYSMHAQAKFSQVRPGLTGVGSIFFRSEEKFLEGVDEPINFYANVIAPYKEALEMWYIDNSSFRLYIKIILVTARVVIFPGKFDFFKVFSSAPTVPDGLRSRIK